MFDQLIDALNDCLVDASAEDRLVSVINQLPDLNDENAHEFVGQLSQFSQANESADWSRLLFPCVSKLATATKSNSVTLDSPLSEELGRLYKACPARDGLRNQILAVLAEPNNESAIELWCELICTDPPLDRATIPLAFGGLLVRQTPLSRDLLNKLIAGATNHVSVAPAIFDLLNFSVREQNLAPHPAEHRKNELRNLLANLIGQLGKIEDGQLPQGVEPQKIAEVVNDSVALIVSLCDALAIMKDEQSIGKLHQALSLRHRRIQTEAAAALAQLGDETGKSALIELAEHPVSRLRVLAYAKELDIENDISLEHRGEIAHAESHLAMWLAEPSQMGVPPSSMELLDQRLLSWPSYQEPIQCYLFTFRYGSDDSGFCNVGISGPLTHAFAADITKLSTGDMYAAFAGWQTVHEELFVVPIERAERIMAADTGRLTKSMMQHALEEPKAHALAGFFGQLALVVEAKKGDVEGFAIVDENGADWIPKEESKQSIDWQLALDIWRGRKLLANFNPVMEF